MENALRFLREVRIAPFSAQVVDFVHFFAALQVRDAFQEVTGASLKAVPLVVSDTLSFSAEALPLEKLVTPHPGAGIETLEVPPELGIE